jgi:head-to-tail connecting protein
MALDDAPAHYEWQGPETLSSTPSLIRIETARPDREWQDLRLMLEQRLYALRNWRLSWWQHWAVLAEAILPRRYHWLIVPNTMTRGLAINRMIVDPTGAQAVRVCTAGLRSGLMSSSRPWFRISAGVRMFKPDRAAKLWFDDTQDRIYRVFKGSNYYRSGTQMFEDLTVFGTAPKIMYEDRRDVLRCYNPCAGEYFLGAGGDFRVNSLYRLFTMTVIQAVEMFGYRNVGSEIQTLWNSKGASLETEVVIAHAIEPNFPAGQDDGQSSLGVVRGGFPYREIYWVWGKYTERPLSVRGFRNKPFIAPRWATTSNDAYGRSPGMDALPDILQLHTMTRRQAEAIEKLVRPPMLASVSLKNQPSSILPGRVTFAEDITKGMKPIYEVEPNIAEMTELIGKIEARVEKWFFNDLFQMLANMEGVQPRNEMEIAERRGEKLEVLGPVVDDITAELSDDIKRAYSIMARRGLIAPKPESLLGVPLDIEFDTMISLAQRAAKTAVMERTMTVATNLAQITPQVMDNLDVDEWYRQYADLSQLPEKVLTDRDQMAQKRQVAARAQQQAQHEAQQASMVTHTAPALARAAKDARAAIAPPPGPQGAAQVDTGGALNALQIMAGMGGASPGATGLPQ